MYQERLQVSDIVTLIDNVINALVNEHKDLIAQKQYWFLYYIKENFRSNIVYLYTINFSLECMGFIPMRRNIRNTFEALIDLCNLSDDEKDYIQVLEYGHKLKNGEYLRKEVPNKYEQIRVKTNKTFKFPHYFRLHEKYEIYKNNHGLINFEYNNEKIDICSFVSDICNEAVHPDVFIDQYLDMDEKKDLLLKLLRIDFYCYRKAVDVLIAGKHFPKYFYKGVFYDGKTSSDNYEKIMTCYYDWLLKGNIISNNALEPIIM